MKKIITSLFLLIFIFGHSQKHEHKTDSIHKIYVPIKQYKKKFTEDLTKEDSLNFKFKDNDTLVMVNQTVSRGVYVPYEEKDSVFLANYKKIAFNHKKGEFSYDTRMKYWEKPIKIFFSKDVSKNVREEFMKFTKEISSEIDSLNISRVRKLEDSNYVIYYSGNYEYESRIHHYKSSNYYAYWSLHSSQIYRNSMRIHIEKEFNDTLVLKKMKDLFLQSLGQFKFLDEFECDNYFANCHSDKKKFSALDLEILKYHYSYGICKGTDLLTFEEQHKQAQELLKEHGIKMNFIHHESPDHNH